MAFKVCVKSFSIRVLSVLLFFCMGGKVIAQDFIRGKVIDAQTGKGISRVSINWLDGDSGGSSDTLGFFKILDIKKYRQLVFGAVGYERRTVDVRRLQDSMLTVPIIASNNTLEEVVVNRKNKKTKDPAIALIEQVIAHRPQNHYTRIPEIRFDEYEKTQFGFVNPEDKAKKFPKPFRFLFENIDSTAFRGQTIAPFYLEENYANVYSSHNPDRSKKIVISHNQTELNPRFFNNDNWQTRFQTILRDVDLYDNTIQITNKGVLSPIAASATAFYRYKIQDTVKIEGKDYIELHFEGKSAIDLLFYGDLLISDDTRYAVHSATLNIGRSANINWINDVQIDLSYSEFKNGSMLPVRADLKMLFGGSKSDVLYGRRETQYLGHRTDSISNENFAGVPVEKRYLLQSAPQVPIVGVRPTPLSHAELGAYQKVDSVQNMRSFNQLVALGYLLAKGYYNAGKVEFGPLEYLYSRNNYEGNRVRLSGRTTRLFSEKAYIEGYTAYGDKDKELKYYLSTAFTLNGERIVQFPANYLRFTVQHDVMEPGRGLGFLKGDGFFRSFGKNRPNKWQFNDIYRIDHLIEFGNHVSVGTAFTHTRRQPRADLFYINSLPLPDTVRQVNTNDLQLILRWAPNEEFTYHNLDRGTVENKYPIFTLQYNKGLKGFWGADYSYDALRFSIFKRLFLSPAGQADFEFSGGRIWGKHLPYTLLELPDVNRDKQGPLVNFDLMATSEFVSDQFLKLTYYHNWNGFFFNRIPLFRRLKWREVTGFKAFYGKLSDANNPFVTPENIQFEADKNGIIQTKAVRNKPYVEGLVGVDNIFKLIRLEYKKRLSYKGGEGVPSDTFTASLHFNF
ncbi:MAG TPA: carboxypeptidase-like regulatory domain-containing protein [Sphingobacterium sp.]|nr:carboxypeptidase-like regulatory domain-containing protein [Sphingobacterium sp.]